MNEEEALQPIWECGYDVSPQSDPGERFVLAYEADGKHPRQWRLSTQALANNRPLDALRSGAWDGRDLEAELSRLDALGPGLLEQWRAEDAKPLTVFQITERLEALGWSEARARNGWLLVRAWLLGWSDVSRLFTC